MSGVEYETPGRVLAVYAHPDDPEISAGGTLARWAAAGAEVHSLVTTKGDKGTSDPDADTDASSRREGRLAKAIEQQTAKLPSDTFLWAAVGSMGVSAALQLAGKRHASLFVGQWAPAFLLLGIYNKLVKQLGSDQYDPA